MARTRTIDFNNIKLYRDRTLLGLICTCLMHDFGADLYECNKMAEFEFCETQTNDAGEPFRIQTCQIVIAEFRKWMAMLAYSVLLDHSVDKTNYQMFYKLNGERIYRVLIEVPLYIDRFLKYLIINHHDQYVDLCQSLTGGYIVIERRPLKRFRHHSHIMKKFHQICSINNSTPHLRSILSNIQFQAIELSDFKEKINS